MASVPDRTVPGGGPGALVGPAGRPRGRALRRLSLVESVEVPRERLLARLTTLDEGVRFVLAVAPPGYGKTTTFRQWAATGRQASAWLSLTAAHVDPVALLTDLGAALAEAGVLQEDVPPGDRPTDRTARSDLMSRVTRPVLVVLDDLDRVRSRDTLDLIVDLGERLPPGSRVALVGRRRPRARLVTLKGENRCLELGPDDLAFTDDESADLLARSGVVADAETVARLVALTEAWPAGMRLVALALQDRTDVRGAARRLTGDHPTIARFFREEVLAGLSVESTRFLLRTSVLDGMSPSLCDAALDIRGSAAWLAEIEDLDLFVVRDGDGEWMRYRHLMRQTLRAELDRREPGEDLKIFRRASSWFDDRSQPAQAIDCALAGEAEVTAARLIAAHTQRLVSQGRVDEVRRWMDALSEETLERYPPVAAVGALVFAFVGDAARARQSLRYAEVGSFDGPLPDGSASLAAAVARARVALSPDGVEAMLVDAELLRRLEPQGRRFLTFNTLLLGVAAMLTGDTARAAHELASAAQYSRTDERPWAAFSLAQRALIAADEGDWGLASLCAHESREIIDRPGMHGFGPGLVTPLACARVALHDGDQHGAREAVRRATVLYRRPSLGALPWLDAQSAIELGHLLLQLGDAAGAELKATEARQVLAVLPTTGVLAERAERLVEAVDHARHRAGGGDGTGLTPAELRVLHLLTTHLSIGDISDEFVVSRNTVKSQVAAIYRKLDASGRTEAVRRAHELGLLDDPLFRP